jgi:hypothetical protein
MSRRKDRERISAMKRLNPDYPGFRGVSSEPAQTGGTPLATAICSNCGRRRNVPLGIVLEQNDSFVCLSCQEETSST